MYNFARILDKFIPRRWLAFLANLLMAAKKDPRRYAVDASGNWVNFQSEGTFVGPDLHTARYSMVQATVVGHWFQDYKPVEGDVVIDVGAGIGEDAVVLSRLVGPTGRVHAIEAHPATFECLRSTVQRSNLTNVSTYQLAIAEKNGTVTISNDAHHLANSIVGQRGGLTVEAQSLDHFIAQSGHFTIDLLKMNIEGAERGAMLGLEKHARKIRHLAISCHDFMAGSVGDDQFRTKEIVQRRLVELGYTVTNRSGATTPWEADVLFATHG